MPTMQDEILVSCRFYFEADGITDKQILEVSGLTSETPLRVEIRFWVLAKML